MQSLNLNLISLSSQRKLAETNSALGASVERLSSGLRINRAKDDVAGLGISQELQRQVQAVKVAGRNASDAVSMVQTAEGSLSSIGDLLGRMKELSVQGANQALSKEQRKFITAEIVQLRNEINAIANRTTYNGLKVLTGDFREAQLGRFDTTTALTPVSKAALVASTIEEGDSSSAVAGKSVIRFGDIKVADAQKGSYQLTNSGAVLTLTRTDSNGAIARQSLTLTTAAPKSKNEVSLAQNDGETTTLDFYNLGVSIEVINTDVGSDHTASEIATKIVGIGTVVNESIKNAGWTSVAGADWASGTTTLKAVVSSSGGAIRTTLTGAQMTSLGLTGVSGYAALGSSSLDSNGTRYEMAFTGSATALNTVLATLQVNNTTGLGDIVVDIVPDYISVFTNPSTGTTSYYRVVSSPDINWDTARSAARSSTVTELGLGADYDNGYLANITSAEESAFIAGKLTQNGWIGASDWYYTVNEAITNRNSLLSSGVLSGSGNAYKQNPLQYANQVAAEGNWYWIDGPEGGLQFQDGNVSGGAVTLVSGEIGQVETAYADWSRSSSVAITAATSGTNLGIAEPNNADSTVYTYPGNISASGEHYAYPIGGKAWNDFSIGNDNVDYYVVEYGGYKGVYGNTSKTILLGTPGTISVGNALSLTSLNTSGAATGIYKVSASEVDKTITLKRFDTDGETLLQTQTIDIKEQSSLRVGQFKTINFDVLGVSFDLQNLSDYSVAIGSLESGFSKEFTIASSVMISAVNENGPLFQIGEAARNEVAISAFRDIRLGNNQDSQSATLFNELDQLITALGAAGDPSFGDFQALETRLEAALTEVASRRSVFGALQNRLHSTMANVGEQYASLKAANSQIQDTDYAFETARLTRMQIGQQAATAMLAQANQLPNVILALIS